MKYNRPMVIILDEDKGCYYYGSAQKEGGYYWNRIRHT